MKEEKEVNENKKDCYIVVGKNYLKCTTYSSNQVFSTEYRCRTCCTEQHGQKARHIHSPKN